MNAIQLISQDLFDKVRSRFTNLEMGDETGAVTIDPAEARFFDFDYVLEGIDLGRVSISLNDPGSLKVYYSQGITENQDDAARLSWYSFLKEMRKFSMSRLLRFDPRDVAKSNLDKNDFKYLASKGPKEDANMNESRWNQKSSKKTSRAVHGATEVIVRHAKPVDETYAGARSQKKNIKAIFIQNKDGERFKYPFNHTAGAFAMAQHVDHGGVPHDPAGKAIIRMSEQIAQLGKFQNTIRPASLHADALGITERALARMNELKTQMERLGKRNHYEKWMAEFVDHDPMGVTEMDAVTMEQYKSKFTETNFNEELASFFPLIHSIMQEANTVDLEDYAAGDQSVSEDITDEDVGVNPMAQFEDWADATEQHKLTDDQIVQLKQALADLTASGEPLQLGPDGSTAWAFFNQLGIEDTDLEDKFADMARVDSAADAVEVFKLWAQEDYPELLVALGMSDTTAPAEPTAPVEPVAPVSEEDDIGFPNTVMPKEDSSSMMQEVAKIVKSFYNADNPTVGPFRGEEGIAITVEKAIAEKFGDQAGQQARGIAEQFMEKLSAKWHSRHGDAVDVADDGLARLKELMGTIKSGVESIGDRGNSGTDFNTNIMSAETMDKSKIPPSMRTDKTPLSLADLEKERTKSPTSPEGLARLKAKLDMLEKGVGEGYTVTPGIDKERYQERSGLEGPFSAKNGKVVYYDKAEGKYYDPDTDMYIDHDDWQAMNEQGVAEDTQLGELSKVTLRSYVPKRLTKAKSEISTDPDKRNIEKAKKATTQDVPRAMTKLKDPAYGKQDMEEGSASKKVDNFTIDDIKNLEKIRDLDALKAHAKLLIKGKPTNTMKPEKISWFYNHIDTLKTPIAVIKMMYDLMLAGEGHKVIGSRNSMSSNSYRTKFSEQDTVEDADQIQEVGHDPYKFDTFGVEIKPGHQLKWHERGAGEHMGKVESDPTNGLQVGNKSIKDIINNSVQVKVMQDGADTIRFNDDDFYEYDPATKILVREIGIDSTSGHAIKRQMPFGAKELKLPTGNIIVKGSQASRLGLQRRPRVQEGVDNKEFNSIMKLAGLNK